VPVTSPLRMLVDLGAVLDAGAVEDVLDRTLERRLVTLAGVERALAELAGRGRAGAGVLRAVLEHRALGSARPESLLEPRMARLIRDAGLPSAAFQHEVRHAGRLVARVDFAYPDVRLAVEVDGWGSHSSPRAFQSDLARQNALVALGWTVLRFTWPDVVRRPAIVGTDIRRVLRTLRTA
jgi:very-short-patch-repair endonuclease